MKIVRLNCEINITTNNVIVGEKHIVFCAGKKVIITDRYLNIITEISDLNKVYTGYFSPNNDKLLLVSTVRDFYVVDLGTFTKTSIHIKTRNIQILEGRGCWDCNGNGVYIPIFYEKTKKLEIRYYCIEHIEDYVVALSILDKNITGMYYDSELNEYLAVLYPVSEDDENEYLYRFNTSLKDIRVYTFSNFYDTSLDVRVNFIKKILFVTGVNATYIYDYEGNLIDCITIDWQNRRILVKDWLDYDSDCSIINQNFEMNIGIKDMPSFEHIRTICNNNSNYIYVGTSSRLIIVNKASKEVLMTKILFGVQSIDEISEGVILLTTIDDFFVLKIEG